MLPKMRAQTLAALLVAWAWPINGLADTFTFDPQTGTEGDWSESDNWDGPPDETPGSDDTAIIPPGLTCIVGAADQEAQSIDIQADDNGTPGDISDDIPGILFIGAGKTLTLGAGGAQLQQMAMNGILRFDGPNGDAATLLLNGKIRFQKIGSGSPVPGPGRVEANFGQSMIGKANGATSNDKLVIPSGIEVRGSIGIATHFQNDGLVQTTSSGHAMTK